MSNRENGPTARQIALGFVVYHGEANFVCRLEAAQAAGWEPYVFDNSPEHTLVRDACRRNTRSRYLTCGRNVGLGVGIASVCANAFYADFAALLFFDQDTVFDVGTLAFIEEFFLKKPEVAATYSAIVFNAKRANDSMGADRFAHRDVLMAISSGSLFYLENLRRIGWHNPTYFVDCVDYEFCLNSSNHGLRVGECGNTPGFDHEKEQADDSYAVFGRVRRIRRYPWTRIADATFASARLLGAALRSRNGSFAIAISRSLAGYLWWQIVYRVLRRHPPGSRK